MHSRVTLGTNLVLIGSWLFLSGLICKAADEESDSRGANQKTTAGQNEPIAVYRAETAPEIDGKLSEACWEKAEVTEVNFYNSGDGSVAKADDSCAEVRVAWDKHYLYIGYDFYDKNLVAEGTGKRQGPPGNRREGCEIANEEGTVDVTEFFISFGSERFFWELHQNALNQWNDVWCTVTEKDWRINDSSMANHGLILIKEAFIAAEEPVSFERAVSMKEKANGELSTPNNPGDTDTGYSAELRLPWSAIGAPQSCYSKPSNKKKQNSGVWEMDGEQFRLLSVYQNPGKGRRYHHSGPEFPGGWFHKSAGKWPIYRCLGESGP